jgi:hypothetical protein
MSYRGCRAVYTIQEENVPNPWRWRQTCKIIDTCVRSNNLIVI